MSKVQVDTIVDKDDISAPTLSKGAIVTGVCTATTFVGAVTGDVTGNADTATTATSATSATTATTATNAQGLTGTPSITVTDVGANDVNATGVGTFGSIVSSGAISGTTGTFSGDVSIADKIVHTGDTNTAIRFPGATQITFETNASERLRVAAGTAGTCLLLTGDRVDSTNKTLHLTLNHYSFNTTNQIDVIGATCGSGYNRVHIGGADDSFGNTAATEIKLYTGANSTTTNGSERFRIASAGQLGVGGANYGTSGQVLTSGGASAAPSWATPSAGAWTSIASGTIDAVDTIITESLDNTYQIYRLNFYAQLDANTELFGLRIKTGGSWKTSSYSTQNLTAWGSHEEGSYTASTDNRMFMPNRGWRCGTGEITFGNVDSTTAYKVFRLAFAGNDSLDAPAGNNNCIVSSFSSGHDSITAITGIRFFKDSNPPTAGWYVLEGCAIS